MIKVRNVLTLTKTIAPQLTMVKTYIPESLLNLFIRTLVITAPMIAARGRTALRIERALS